MAKKKPAPRRRFLVVARTASGSWPHPVEVRVHPDGANSIVGFSIGPHAANAGGMVHLYTVLDETQTGLNPNFAEEFDAAELHWLVPLLVRLNAGEDVTDEIVSAYRERHGRAPETVFVERRGS
ncbi:hypothetical protein AB0I28_12125 [Phytomonospora sp. NPDC050363]|uniref:hypothetical protein n=1 Tax=Phytomonospora sp. NPDC050363 TaxID=3155642 RepID=UPI0033F24040